MFVEYTNRLGRIHEKYTVGSLLSFEGPPLSSIPPPLSPLFVNFVGGLDAESGRP